MLGEDTLFERQLKDFQEIENDSNKNIDESKLNEGQFSWLTSDTQEPIYSTEGHQETVYMIDDKGNKWQEDAYEGYGVFGGKDFYELLAEMNGLELTGDTEKDRELGIDLAFKDTADGEDTPGVKYPKLVSDSDVKYEDVPNPESHENQGWFEEEGRDEHGFDDEDFDESKTDEQGEVVEEARTKEDIEQKIKDVKKKMEDLDAGDPDFDDKVDKYDREIEKLEADLKDLEEKCKKVKEGDEEAKEQDESKVNEATVGCPRCGGELDVVEDDVRGEWERIDYYCPKCKRDFSRKIEFDQAGMTTSDEWDDEEGEPVDETKTNEEEIEGENKVDTVSNDPSFERAVEKFAQIESDENKNVAEDVQVEEDLFDEPEFPAIKDEKPGPSPAVHKAMEEEDDTNVIVDRLKEWIGLDVPDDSIAAVVWALAREPELLDMISKLPTKPVESKEDD